MTPTEETPAVTWRNNKTVLWLVRVGFILQFFIPAIVCCAIIHSYHVSPTPYPVFAPDDPNFDKAYNAAFMHYVRSQLAGITLAVLVVQCAIFTLILRFAKLRSANGVLQCLIAINLIHGMLWLAGGWPWTIARLTPPTILYLIAIIVEWRAARHAETHSS